MPYREEQNITYNCSIEVNLNSCSNSSVAEPTDKECVVNNSLYLYNSSCNVYCSEKIQTDFKDFYETFQKVDVKDNAIASGRFIPIKDSPKISINKTCYQSTSAAEYPDWKASVGQQINAEYVNKRSELTLNVDENRYTLFANFPSINIKSNSGDSVVYEIKYEHKMDPNINKYISIETGKDVGNNLDKYKDAVIEFNNEYGTIMIKRSGSGTYQYSLDLVSTKLNKYMNGSNNLTKIIASNYSKVNSNIQNGLYYITTYNYIFNNTINRNYASTDLNFSCDYKKANPCACPINTVCNPITCEPVINSPCGECNSECGCKDNKTCDPIPCPNENDPTPKECNPEKEVCFPNGDLIYYHGAINSLSDYYIKYNRGYTDYELYREAEPLYVIKLDGNKIKAIREYNDYKNHDYSDSDLECENGKNCISKFLRGRADHFSINLIESGTCKNINPSSFDSCITRKGS